MRTPAFGGGARVALVDQWVDSGGSMLAAIDLVRSAGHAARPGGIRPPAIRRAGALSVLHGPPRPELRARAEGRLR